MKTISVTIYDFDELDENIRQKIIDEKGSEIGWKYAERYDEDYRQTLKKFSDAFGIFVYDYTVNDCGYSFCVSYDDDCVFEQERVSGKRLRRLLNHYMDGLLEPKKYVKYSAGYNKHRGAWNKCRVSHIYKETIDDCPLTGCCYDYDILCPIQDILDKPIPDDLTFEKAIHAALDSFFGGWSKNYEYFQEPDGMREAVENEYQDKFFLSDGTMFDALDVLTK